MNIPVEFIWALIALGSLCLLGTITAELIERRQRAALNRELEPNRQLLLLSEVQPPRLMPPAQQQRQIPAPESEAL